LRYPQLLCIFAAFGARNASRRRGAVSRGTAWDGGGFLLMTIGRLRNEVADPALLAATKEARKPPCGPPTGAAAFARDRRRHVAALRKRA
jgi:hypothetical protein